MQIDSFTGRNAFLANWYKCEDLFVEFYDHYGLATWRASTVDHAYGALMAPDYNVAIDIVMAPTAYLASYIAKRRNKVGKAEYRIEVMRKILEDKFSDKALAYRLGVSKATVYRYSAGVRG